MTIDEIIEVLQGMTEEERARPCLVSRFREIQKLVTYDNELKVKNLMDYDDDGEKSLGLLIIWG